MGTAKEVEWEGNGGRMEMARGMGKRWAWEGDMDADGLGWDGDRMGIGTRVGMGWG